MTIDFDFDPNDVLVDSTTDIEGVNHIGLSVQNLDRVLEFYRAATGFEVIHKESFENDASADILFARDNVKLRTAILRAPNWVLELSEFAHNDSVTLTDMPVIGPGMSHTCYQSPKDQPLFDKFAAQGARFLNRHGKPVYSPTYGVSYVYAYDPEGNLLEMEELDGEQLLKHAGYLDNWDKDNKPIWMSQVSLFTPDRDRLMQFYHKVFQTNPHRIVEVPVGEFGDNLFDIDNAKVQIGWFRLNRQSKVMEILQFIDPPTPQSTIEREPTSLGYSFSLEVSDIEAEYQRVQALGVEFFSPPVKLGRFIQAYARDIDGNIFSLRQPIDLDGPFSVKAYDKRGGL